MGVFYGLTICVENFRRQLQVLLCLAQQWPRKARPPQFKGNKYFTTMVYNQSGFKITPGKIRVSHKYNNVPLEFVIPEKFAFDKKKVKQVAIYEKQGRYFVSITYEAAEPPYVDNGKYQALDLGITKLVTAVNTAGKFVMVKNKRPDKYWQPKIKAIQRRRDHCIKGSNRWKLLDNILRGCKVNVLIRPRISYINSVRSW